MDNKNYNIVDGFNVIAPAYDLANDAMTFGLHRLWRRKLCRVAAKVTPKNGKILDLATGTADVAIGLVRERTDVQVTGIDPAVQMLNIGREKIQKRVPLQAKQIELTVGDARTLEFASESFDTVTISWGIRNVRPFSAGLKEILRVLKPGGHLVVLESGRPEFKIVRQFYGYYSKLLPLIGGRLSGFKPAYQYYVQSADSFPSGRDFMADLYEAGFVGGKYYRLGGSVVYLYIVQKPQN